MTKKSVVQHILGEHSSSLKESGKAFAPTNIALCKYWGKRDEELNLPKTSSLSISLGKLGAHTTIRIAEDTDSIIVNGTEASTDSQVHQRASSFLDLFRSSEAPFFAVETESNIPLAAGLASSASGFAALVLALNDLHGWNLNARELSVLARLGSGSAARSVYTGFVRWNAGKQKDGMDSFAEKIDATWPELRVGLVMLSRAQKPISSRAAMRRTIETSVLYKAWPTKVDEDLPRLESAIATKDFDSLGQTAESNALAMHATMIDSSPPILYWLKETLVTMRAIWKARDEGLPVYFTIDAGPNVKVLFEEENRDRVKALWPNLEIAEPFAG